MEYRRINYTDYISKEILKLGPELKPVLILKHRITLGKSYKDANGLIKRAVPVYNYLLKAAGEPNKTSYNMMFRTINEYILLESQVNFITTANNSDTKIIIKLYYKDFVDILRILNETASWYDDLQKIYMYDENNKLIDVKPSCSDLVSIAFFKGFSHGSFISFNPNVMYDNDIVYPSVTVRGVQGVLCDLSVDEFLTLKLCLTEYMNNFHQLSLGLINITYAQLNHLNHDEVTNNSINKIE